MLSTVADGTKQVVDSRPIVLFSIHPMSILQQVTSFLKWSQWITMLMIMFMRRHTTLTMTSTFMEIPIMVITLVSLTILTLLMSTNYTPMIQQCT